MGICMPDSCSKADIKQGLLNLEDKLQTENVTWKFLIINCQEQKAMQGTDVEDIIML